VAFRSDAKNLVANDTNAVSDVFVRDLISSSTSRISVSTSGSQANGDSYDARISYDGNFVTFASSASNLVSGDTNASEDAFLRNRAARTTTRVSVASNGAQGNGSSFDPVVSDDGRFVAFESLATSLDGADINGSNDIYVRDRQMGTTMWVSAGQNAGRNGGSYDPQISGNGEIVTFSSDSPLLSLDTNSYRDVFHFESTNGFQSGQTIMLSMDSWYRSPGNGPSDNPGISGDGLTVAFTFDGTSLVPQSADTFPKIYMHRYDRARIICYVGLVSLALTSTAVLAKFIASQTKTRPEEGQLVYRVWGGDAGEFGKNWTPGNPTDYGPDRYRQVAGLPDRFNAGTQLTFGFLDSPSSVTMADLALSVNPFEHYNMDAYRDSGVAYRTYGGGLMTYQIPSAEAHVLNRKTVSLVPPQGDGPYGGPPKGCTPAPRGCVGERLVP